MHEGAVTQFGNTIDVYNRPADIQTAQTFADPPLNVANVSIKNRAMSFSGKPLSRVDPIDDGQYTLGIRPHHMSLSASRKHTVSIECVIGTSEITGSETFIHVEVAGEKWVILTHGVHRLASGTTITVHLDPSRFYLFDMNGKLAQAPASVAEAA